MLSNRAVNKSINNGFTQAQHLEATENINKLCEKAWLAEANANKNNEPNIISVKRLHCETTVGGEKAIARITAKEIMEYGTAFKRLNSKN